MSDYIDALTHIISRTTHEVYFNDPRMDYDEFSRIVKASNNTNTLIFHGLTFRKRGRIDFGDNIDYNINRFSLQCTGLEWNSDWRYDKSTFNMIVEQIKHSNMHQQLQKFNIFQCKVDVEDVDLPGVTVVREGWSS